MRIPIPILTKVAAVTVVLAGWTAAASAQIVYSGGTYTQDFDTLATTGTSSVLPTGWALSESGTSPTPDSNYSASTGSSTSGDTFSFGVSGTNPASDRALGGLLTGTFQTIFGASFTNQTGATITDLAVAYTGEEWRLGATGGRTDQINFEYSLNATSLTTGTYTPFSALNFVTPNTTGAVGLRDGNAAGNFTAISSTISGLNFTNGGTLWIRWTDFNATGSDDGLGVDNFSIAAVPEPATTALLSAGAFLLVRRPARRRKTV